MTTWLRVTPRASTLISSRLSSADDPTRYGQLVLVPYRRALAESQTGVIVIVTHITVHVLLAQQTLPRVWQGAGALFERKLYSAHKTRLGELVFRFFKIFLGLKAVVFGWCHP